MHVSFTVGPCGRNVSKLPTVFRCPSAQGTNGTFRMYLEGDGGTFEVTPPEGVNEATFMIRVRDPAGLDYETARGEAGVAAGVS